VTGLDAETYLSASGCVPVGPCPRCEREVVAYAADEGVAGEGQAAAMRAERYACVHCDGPVRQVVWLEDEELDGLGYAVTDPRLGGCATGCANGGCSAAALRVR
jgi:hypothetical protein